MILYNVYTLLENKGTDYVYIAQSNKLFKIAPLIKKILSDRPETDGELQKIIDAYAVKTLSKTVIEELKRMKLVFDEKKEIRNIDLKKLTISEMTLLVTQQCNLRCSYCFGEGGEYNNKGVMTIQVARRAVDFLYQCSGTQKDITILFFGGEPLINFEIIKKTVEYCKKKDKEYGKKCHYSITTNGTIVNQEIMNFLTDNKFLVQVSIDGTEEVTNANRFDINKKGAYSRIIQGAKILQDKVIVGARGTITPIGLNVSENTKHLLEEGFAYVHLAPANNMLNKKEIEELLNYYDQYCTDFETLLKDKKYRDCILRHNLYSILREIHEGGIRNIYCAAGLKAVSVDIMGDIYPCHRFVGNEDFSMGNVVMKTFSRDSVYEQLSKIPEKCNNCICQAVCLGGCLHDNFITMKDINVPAPSNCNLQVFLTMRALKIYVSLLEEEKKCLFGKE